MRTHRKILLRLRSFFRRRAADADLDSELRFHLEREISANISAGMSPPEARHAALLKFGGVEQLKEECRDTRNTNYIHDLAQDLRYALRMLRKSPGFTAIAVLTLALGIGANTAIFSIVDAVLLRSLPYPHPDQLVLMFEVPLKQPDALSAFSYRDFTACREQNSVFSDMAGNAFHDLTLTGAGDPSVVNTADVTPEIFSVLGAKPLLGRTLRPDDGKQGAAPVAVVSENLWRSRFGADPNLIGKPIILDMRSFTVVGILPANFRYPDGAPHQDVWIPIAQDPLFGPLLSRPGVPALAAIARLRTGVSLEQAKAEVKALGARFAKEFPTQDAGSTIRLVPYRQFVVGKNVKSALLILLGAVGLVLLIACANIANLLLSRATSRGREIALRIALGARRGRIVRQLLTESALLGLLGGIAGVLLAFWAIWILRPLLPADLTRISSIHLGGPVLTFALVLSLVAAVVFGLAPALLATQSNLQTNIQQGGAHAGQRGGLMRNFLAVAEIALAMVLLVAGGLLIRSFALVTSVNPGFDPANLIRTEVSLPQFQYSTPQQWSSFASELLSRLHAQAAFRDSALGGPLPMDRQGEASFPFSIVGNPPLPPGKSLAADWATVSPDYFRVMRIPLLRGRFFTEEDSSSNPNVAIISETLAERYFPNQNPIGRQMKFGFPPNGNVSREIVGIVGDVRDTALSQKPGPMMYVPFAQEPLYGGEVVVRSSMNAATVAAGVRRAVQSIDKNLPVTDIERFPDALGASVAQERFRTFVLSSFSAIALLLAAIGIFGVISYSASLRTREIGIRMALGAHPRDVLRLILQQGAKLALVGLSVGIVAVFALTRLMASLLYDVSATDPVTFIAVAILLTAVAMLACYIPARRAMHVDAMIALRYE